MAGDRQPQPTDKFGKPIEPAAPPPPERTGLLEKLKQSAREALLRRTSTKR
jgi:1-acyl-sn-glycerol-3-phosphate acyltransferase